MTYPHGGAAVIYRDTKGNGDGSSHSPDKAQIRDYQVDIEERLATMQQTIAGLLGAGGAVIYLDEATGRAAVADGTVFYAIGVDANDSIDVWQRTDANGSVRLDSIPSSEGLLREGDVVASQAETHTVSFPFQQAPGATGERSLAGTLVSDLPLIEGGEVSVVRLQPINIAGGADSIIHLATFTLAGSTFARRSDWVAVTIPAGSADGVEISISLPSDLIVNAGEHIGVYSPDRKLERLSGNDMIAHQFDGQSDGGVSSLSEGHFALRVEVKQPVSAWLDGLTALPSNPSDGQQMVWSPTGEQARYSSSDARWNVSGRPLATLWDDFAGLAADADLTTRLIPRAVDAEHIDAPKAAKVPDNIRRWDRTHHVATVFADGAGRIKADPEITSTDTNDDRTDGMVLAHAGCTDKVINFTVEFVASGGEVNLHLVTDGRKGLLMRFSTNRVMRLMSYDKDVDGSWTLQASATVPNEFWPGLNSPIAFSARVTNGQVEVRHPISGAVVTADAGFSSPMIGLSFNASADGRLNQIEVLPLDTKATIAVSDTVECHGPIWIANMRDPDGYDHADITGNGLPDIVAVQSVNHPTNPGEVAGVFVWIQKAPGVFDGPYTIDANADIGSSDKFTKLEGVAVSRYPTTSIIVSDQSTGDVWRYILKDPKNPVKGVHPRVRLNAVQGECHRAQDIVVHRFEGQDVDTIFSFYQGSEGATGPQAGGIKAWRLNAKADPLLTASYTEVQIAEHPGAWSAEKTFTFMDVVQAGDFSALVFSARDNHRNPDGIGGVFAVPVYSDLSAQPVATLLNDSAMNGDYTHIAAGAVLAGSDGRDIVAVKVGEGLPLKVLDAANGWQVATNPFPDITTGALDGNGQVYNVRNVSGPGDAVSTFLMSVGYRGFIAVGQKGGVWEQTVIAGLTYKHPSENPDKKSMTFGGIRWIPQPDSFGGRLGFIGFSGV